MTGFTVDFCFDVSISQCNKIKRGSCIHSRFLLCPSLFSDCQLHYWLGSYFESTMNFLDSFYWYWKSFDCVPFSHTNFEKFGKNFHIWTTWIRVPAWFIACGKTALTERFDSSPVSAEQPFAFDSLLLLLSKSISCCWSELSWFNSWQC